MGSSGSPPPSDHRGSQGTADPPWTRITDEGTAHTGGAPDAFRQRLARGRATLRPLLEERCGLSNTSRACRCDRQAAAKQRLGKKLPVYEDPVDASVLSRAEDQMGALARLRHVFAVEPPPMPRKELWGELAQRLPDLLG